MNTKWHKTFKCEYKALRTMRSRLTTDWLFSILLTDCAQARDRSAHLPVVMFRWLVLVWFCVGRDGLQLSYLTSISRLALQVIQLYTVEAKHQDDTPTTWWDS